MGLPQEWLAAISAQTRTVLRMGACSAKPACRTADSSSRTLVKASFIATRTTWAIRIRSIVRRGASGRVVQRAPVLQLQLRHVPSRRFVPVSESVHELYARRITSNRDRISSQELASAQSVPSRAIASRMVNSFLARAMRAILGGSGSWYSALRYWPVPSVWWTSPGAGRRAARAVLAHDPRQAVLSARRSGLLEGFVHPRRAVGAAALAVDLTDRARGGEACPRAWYLGPVRMVGHRAAEHRPRPAHDPPSRIGA